MRRPSIDRFFALGLIIFFSACTNEKAPNLHPHRPWGRDLKAANAQAKAEIQIDPYTLAGQIDAQNHVLNMTFAEVRARLGLLEYQGQAKFHLERNGHTLKTQENTLIQYGAHDALRVLQKDSDGHVTREVFLKDDIFYLRNGPGQLRNQGRIEDRHFKIVEEAWSPFRIFCQYYGERLTLGKVGHSQLKGRGVAKYTLELGEGPQWVSALDGTKKRPRTLSGQLFVDEATSVPLRVVLEGELDAADEGAPGKVRIALDFTLTPKKTLQIPVGKSIAKIRHFPIELDPLAFLKKKANTSTTIGGNKSPSTKGEP